MRAPWWRARRRAEVSGSAKRAALYRKLAASPELYQRFQDEARLIATLRHPHIVPITDFDRDDNGIPFFVMDLLEGENLQQRLKHKEMLPLSQSLEILQQVGSALSAARMASVSAMAYSQNSAHSFGCVRRVARRSLRCNCRTNRRRRCRCVRA